MALQSGVSNFFKAYSGDVAACLTNAHFTMWTWDFAHTQYLNQKLFVLAGSEAVFLHVEWFLDCMDTFLPFSSHTIQKPLSKKPPLSSKPPTFNHCHRTTAELPPCKRINGDYTYSFTSFLSTRLSNLFQYFFCWPFGFYKNKIWTIFPNMIKNNFSSFFQKVKRTPSSSSSSLIMC